MAFDSFSYAALLVAVALGARVLGASRAVPFLLAVSLGFAALAAWWYPLLLLGVSAAAWVFGEAVRARTGQSGSRVLLWGAIGCTLLPLALFKYAASWLPFVHTASSEATWLDAATWVMPLGLSYYTLQAIAWIVDCARGDAALRPGVLRFLLFFAFFPKVGAGPILRHDEFFPESRRVRLSSAAVWEALCRIVYGLFKKVVVADNLAVVANALFAAPQSSSAESLLGLTAYSVQIYCDFAGYTDIAIGSAMLLGYRLPENFRWPYLAKNPTEFWQRWHITLSNWLRDYVYFAMPGLRSRSRVPLYAALLLTMFVCGIWHGSTWPFVVWGLSWGVLLVIYRAMQPLFRTTAERLSGLGAVRDVFAVAAMQVLVAAGWVIFRAESLASSGEVFGSLVRGGWSLALTDPQRLAIVLIAGFWLYHIGPLHRGLLTRLPANPWHPLGVAFLLLLLSACTVFQVPNSVPFQYFRF